MAFLLPAIEQLAKKPVPRGGAVSILVLSPTRELAMQVRLRPYVQSPNIYSRVLRSKRKPILL